MELTTYTPECTCIKDLMVSIRWYLGSFKEQTGIERRMGILGGTWPGVVSWVATIRVGDNLGASVRRARSSRGGGRVCYQKEQLLWTWQPTSAKDKFPKPAERELHCTPTSNPCDLSRLPPPSRRLAACWP